MESEALGVLTRVIFQNAGNEAEATVIAEVIRNRSTKMGKTAYEIVIEPGQFTGIKPPFRKSSSNPALYAAVAKMATALLAGTFAEDTHPGVYFFTRVKGGYDKEPWAVGKLEPAGELPGLYLYKWK